MRGVVGRTCRSGSCTIPFLAGLCGFNLWPNPIVGWGVPKQKEAALGFLARLGLGLWLFSGWDVLGRQCVFGRCGEVRPAHAVCGHRLASRDGGLLGVSCSSCHVRLGHRRSTPSDLCSLLWRQ